MNGITNWDGWPWWGIVLFYLMVLAGFYAWRWWRARRCP